MKIQTSELRGFALDWAVAKCEGYNHKHYEQDGDVYTHPITGEWHHNGNWKPSSNWVQGGPIIEREKIDVRAPHKESFTEHWTAWLGWGTSARRQDGPTPQIAAMRCYVASKLGDEVEIPEELV